MSVSPDYIHVDDSRIAQFEPDTIMYRINTIVSSICFFIVIINCLLLSTDKTFFKKYKVLIALNIMDMIVLLGIFLEARTRQATFAQITATRVAKVVNSRDCIELWTLVQVYADFGMPLIEFFMGLERFVAVMYPAIYRKTFQTFTIKLIFISFFTAAITTATPAFISITWPQENVKFLCGRKAAFGTLFGIFDYAFNVAMISMALLLNIVTCLKAMAIQQSRNSMRKIKCYTGIAVVSTVLVSVPNLFSIINATWIQLPDAMMTPAPILACINCSLQFFINLCLNDEYRTRFLKVFTCGRLQLSHGIAERQTQCSSNKTNVVKSVSVRVASSRSFVTT